MIQNLRALSLFILLVPSVALSQPSDPTVANASMDQDLIRAQSGLMGTQFSIVIADPIKPEKAQTALTDAFKEIARVESILSEWRPNSEISAINQAAGDKPISVSPETFAVLRAAHELAVSSGGAFDPTWAALRGIWRFDLDPPQLPLRSDLDAALKGIGYDFLVLNEDEQTVFLSRQGATIGLGAIAKGYGIDRAVRILRSHGLKNFLVDGGGDLRVIGKKTSGPWSVGIQHPRLKHQLLFSLPLTDRAVVTSGDYQRYFELGNRRYHHIIDLKTGLPARGVVAVTVLAKTTMLADALATALFVMGPDRGKELLKKYEGVQALVLTPDGKIHTLGIKNDSIPALWNEPVQGMK